MVNRATPKEMSSVLVPPSFISREVADNGEISVYCLVQDESRELHRLMNGTCPSVEGLIGVGVVSGQVANKVILMEPINATSPDDLDMQILQQFNLFNKRLQVRFDDQRRDPHRTNVEQAMALHSEVKTHG